jgi:hypothetical protein
MRKHAQGDLASVAVLRGPRLQSHGQFLKVHPVPGQSENLAADTPPEGVGHVQHDLDVPLASLATPGALKQFTDAFEWVLQEIRES